MQLVLSAFRRSRLLARMKGRHKAHDLSPQSIPQPAQVETRALGRNALARRALPGSFLGLAWGASLRAWMALLALELGDRPRVTWLGTFGAVLLPAAVQEELARALGGTAMIWPDRV